MRELDPIHDKLLEATEKLLLIIFQMGVSAAKRIEEGRLDPFAICDERKESIRRNRVLVLEGNRRTVTLEQREGTNTPRLGWVY